MPLDQSAGLRSFGGRSMTISDAGLDDLKARMPCNEVAAKWVKLRKSGRAWVGPCPICSRDRNKKTATKFKVTAERWMCAVCMDGGDVIQLVRKVENKDFNEAVDWLGGVQEIDPVEAERRKVQRDADAAEQAGIEQQFRERERETLYEILKRALKGAALDGSSLMQYMALRGLEGAPLKALRCIEAMPYYDSGKKDASVVHRGPAMLAPYIRHGKFSGLHITYLDLARPNGKLKLVDGDGEDLPAKKMRGSKVGGLIPLVEPPAGVPVTRVFIGEGIETVLSVWCAMNALGLLCDGDAFYAAGDLGNLGGKASESVVHPTLKSDAGRARRVAGPWPEPGSPGIELPETAHAVVILGDGDSDAFTTRCALARAALRFEKPGRDVCVAMAPDGSDFNDIWRHGRDAAAVCALIDAAAPLSPADVMALATAPPRSYAANSAAPDAAANGGADSSSPLSAEALAKADSADPPWDSPMPDEALAKSASASAAAAPASAAAGSARRSQNGRHPGHGRPGARSANRARWEGPPHKYGDGPEGLNCWLAFFPMTELGLIERFVQRQKHRLKYCDAIGWLLWNGRAWSRIGALGTAISAGHEVVRQIQDEAQAIRDADLDEMIGIKPAKKKDDEPEEIWLSDVLEQFGRASETKAKMTLHEHAAPYLAVEVDQLDADPFAINLMNGTLLVRRSWNNGPLLDGWTEINRYIRLKPHDQADLITKMMPVTFDAGAVCPQYDRFLEVVQPETSVREFIDDWNGYALTGDASEQRLVFHWGTGKNGKSTEMAVRLAISGDYGKSIPIETFSSDGKPRSGGQATPDLAMLRRVRNLITAEPEKGWKLNEALIKTVTGNDEMAVRELHRPYFMLIPEFKVTIGGNFKPVIGGGDAESGIWRRVTLVPWTIKIPAASRDKHLLDKLKAERAGILNRWLGGLSHWMERGLVLPEEVARATEKFRVDSDPLGRFLAECTRENQEGQVQTTILHQLFCAWCKVVGEREWTITGFGRAMMERGFDKHKSSTHFWLGIEPIRIVDDFIDSQGNPLVEREVGSGPAGASSRRASAYDDEDIPI
jgi:putative DNA primase/helicase